MKIECCKFNLSLRIIISVFFFRLSSRRNEKLSATYDNKSLIVYYKTLRNLDYKNDELKLRQQKKGRVKRINFNQGISFNKEFSEDTQRKSKGQEKNRK